jgi:hypothetical protein
MASVAFVQIFLNISLACIAHTRELIPWNSPCFQTRFVDQKSLQGSTTGNNLYSTFQNSVFKRNNASQEVKVLVRGGHRRADKILNMLASCSSLAFEPS